MNTISALVAACTLIYGAALPAQKMTTLRIDPSVAVSTVSPILYGLMTEEINYSYDGGLYPEMVRNRAFNTLHHGLESWPAFTHGNALNQAGVGPRHRSEQSTLRQSEDHD